MLRSGASRELFEMWAPDKRNGIIAPGLQHINLILCNIRQCYFTVLLLYCLVLYHTMLYYTGPSFVGRGGRRARAPSVRQGAGFERG